MTLNSCYIILLLTICLLIIILHGFKFKEVEFFEGENKTTDVIENKVTTTTDATASNQVSTTTSQEQKGSDMQLSIDNGAYKFKTSSIGPVTVPTSTTSTMTAKPSATQCVYPFESVEFGCQIKCPSDKFLTANPNIKCQRVFYGDIQNPVNNVCQSGYKQEQFGCAKPVTNCPDNYDLIDGGCYEKCPTGTISTVSEVDFDHDGATEKKKVRVCHAQL